MRVFVLALVIGVFPVFVFGQEDTRPWSEQPFLGLSLRDTADGTVVGWVYPGPLGGTGFDSSVGIKRGDNFVSLDGQEINAADFKEAVAAMSPGSEIALTLRRADSASADGSIPKGGQGGSEYSVDVTLGDRDSWSGTIRRGLGGRTIADGTEGEFESMILEKAKEVGIDTPEDGVLRLVEYLGKIQDDALDPNSLDAVIKCFRRPLSVDAVEAEIASHARAIADGGLDEIAVALSEVLSLPQPTSGIRAFMKQASLMQGRLEGAQMESGWWEDAAELVRALRDSVYIFEGDAESRIRVIRQSPYYASWMTALQAEKLGDASISLGRLVPAEADRVPIKKADLPLEDGPEDRREIVKGDVLAFEVDFHGNISIVGGPGPNEYDMSRVANVWDLGGDDVYHFEAMENLLPKLSTRDQVIVDEGGNDLYDAKGDFVGPGTGFFGLSLVDDRAGNDTYRSNGQFSIGAGLFGVGIILDHAGDDIYENTGPDSGWAMGVGFYGAGLIVDKGGSDVYLGEKLVQGIGGPRGFGAIIDASGNDMYTANGPNFKSVYGTPAVYVGMSQGYGYGVRGYAAGGVGAIYDFGGDDQYEAGEFSQAGGYYFGLGIVHDAAGNDLYFANRYGQAFSAHQAVGIMIDDAGDDTYWSKTAASQAGTWDQSIGMLVDRGGNDSYRCDGLGQGGASMQAIALLIDLDGMDRYTGRGGAVQGGSGGNSYHYNADKVFSLSGLFDLGADVDAYSSGRTNDTTVKTGAFDEKNPENSSLYGVFVDQ